MSTLNFLNVIIHLGGIRAKRQISGWRLAHADDAFLQQSVRAGGMQTYFNINRSKTSLGKLLLQEKKDSKMTQYTLMFNMNVFVSLCSFPLHSHRYWSPHSGRQNHKTPEYRCPWVPYCFSVYWMSWCTMEIKRVLNFRCPVISFAFLE